MADQSSVLAGALGAVLGFLGSEAADTVLFERLLWPERFYNDSTNASTLLKQALFLSMGGPIHAAALKTLEKMGRQGLYLGSRRGNMLGTSFFSDTGVKYHSSGVKGEDGDDDDNKTRNGFWVEVARRINYKSLGDGRLPRFDDENPGEERSTRFRTIQAVHHLTLSSPELETGRKSDSQVSLKKPLTESPTYVVQENKRWRALPGIACSEFISIMTAVAAILLDGPNGGWWMAIYMVIPLLLKILSFIFSVHRETLETFSKQSHADGPAPDRIENYRLVDEQDNGFYLVITGPRAVVTQFFRHYGHPLRHINSGRLREVLSIAVIYLFVFYFPFGLAANLWLPERLQYLWLSYQLYTVFAMHLLKFIGWGRCGSTQERVARGIMMGNSVELRSSPGTTVCVSWQTTYVPSVSAAEYTMGHLMKTEAR